MDKHSMLASMFCFTNTLRQYVIIFATECTVKCDAKFWSHRKCVILFSGLWIKWIPLFLNSLAMWYYVPRSKSVHHDGHDILIDTDVECQYTKVLNQHYALAFKLIQHSKRPYHTDRPLCQHHHLHMPRKILPTSAMCPILHSPDQHIHVSS
jgi:hypothetical protein